MDLVARELRRRAILRADLLSTQLLLVRVLRRWGGHIRSREVTHLPLSDDCLPGLLTWIAARCEPLASLESRGESLRTQGQSGTLYLVLLLKLRPRKDSVF